MHPILLNITTPSGVLPVYSYGAMIAIGFLASYLYVCRLAIQRGIDGDHITDLFIVIIAASIVGARGNYVVTHWQEYVRHTSSIPKVWEGGMVFLGGFIGAMVGGFVYLRARGLPLGPYYDMFAPAVPFACALGRIGCFLNGCCYGVVCSLPWGMTFPSRDGLPSVPRHPTQLYELGVLVAMTGVLHRFYRTNRRPGMAMVALAYLYSSERFLIEFIRDESTYEHYVFGLTLGQSTCLITFVCAAVCHAWIATRCRPTWSPDEILAREAASQSSSNS